MTAITKVPAPTASFRRRRALLGTSALAGSLLLASPVLAQSLPEVPNALLPLPTVANGADISVSGNTMTVNLNDASRIIDFKTYNIAAGNTVDYTTTTAGTTNLVAVNRVLTGGGASLINGDITADAGISVWLINQEGITYNGKATLGGGSLMLSTLDFADTVDATFRANFAAAGAANSTPFNFAGSGAGNITIASTGLNVAGSIIAVGEKITTSSALTTTAGSIVLVAGSDVTFTNGLGNPLSFTIDAGTQIGGGVAVNNNLSGQSVVIAGGLQNNLTAALLNVNAGATVTATAANGAVVLATESTSFGAENISIANGTNAEPSINVAGTLGATGANGDIVVDSAHDVTGAGNYTAARNLDVTAGNNINVSGNLTATAGTLTALAGGDGTFGGLKAGTNVSVNAINTTFNGLVDAGVRFGVTATGDAKFNGNAQTGTGDVDLTVLGDTDITGNIDAGRDVLLTRTVDLTQSGNVTAKRNVNYIIGNDATVTGAIEGTAGFVSAAVGNDGTFAAVTAGTDIDISAGRNLTTTGLLDADGNVTLEAGTSPSATAQGNLAVQGNVSAGGTFDATGNAVTLGLAGQTRLQQAAGAITVTANERDVRGLGSLTLQSTGGSDISLISDGTGVVNFDRTTTAIDAGSGDVVVKSAPTITLGDVTAANLFTQGDSRLFATGEIKTGDLTIANELQITSDTGSILTGKITLSTLGASLKIYAAGPTSDITTDALATNGGYIFASAERNLLIQGTASTGTAQGSVGLQAGNNLTVTGLVTAGIDLAARADGFIDIAAASAGDDITLFANGAVTLGNGTITGAVPDGASLLFGVPGVDDSITNVGSEDPALVGRQMVLNSATAGISSGGTLANNGGGDVTADAPGLISLGTVNANTGGSVFVTSSNNSVLAGSLNATDSVIVSAFADALIGSAGAGTIDIDAGRDAALGTGLAGSTLTIDAGRDLSSTTNLDNSGGDVFLNAGRNVNVARVNAGAGSVGVLGGGSVQATNLIASRDVAVRGGTTGAGTATDVTIGSATAGDDIDVVALNGNLSLGTGLANAALGSGGSEVSFGTPGVPGAVGVGLVEDAQLVQSTIRLRSATGNVTSATQLSTANGDIIVNAAQDVSLVTAIANGPLSGGSIAIRAGRDVTQANILTSNNEDVSIGAGRNIAVGTVTAADDIDILAGGRLTGTALNITGGADRARFADVSSGSAGAVGGVNFTTPDDADLALANVVRIRVGDVGNGGAGPVGLIADNVLASSTFTAQALLGDIRLGDVRSSGDIDVQADNGSVSGTPNGYAPVSGIGIGNAGGTVLINVTNTGIFGNITADTVRTTANADTLRIRRIDASTVNLAAGQTLDVGTINAAGTVDLLTTDGPAGAFGLEITGPGDKLVDTFGDANLTTTGTDARIFVRANNGAAQLGELVAGSGLGLGTFDQIDVSAMALTAIRTDALDGSLSLMATDGLLQLAEGFAAQHATLVKRNDDGISSTPTGDVTTDVLRVLDTPLGSTARIGLTAGDGITIRSETSAFVAQALAIGTNLLDRELTISAAKNISLDNGEATTGSIGLYAGGDVSGGLNKPFPATNGSLIAAQDVTIRAGGNILVNNAEAGDDIDFASTGGNVRLDNGTAKAGVSDFTSVTFTGTPGQPGTIAVTAGEDADLAASSTIRLRAAAGDVTSAGTLLTQGRGEILVNAAQDAALNIATATNGSIGQLAGGFASANNLGASIDVFVQGGTGVNVGTAQAGDDIDVVALTGNLTLTTGLSQGSPGTGGSSLVFGAPGSLGAVTVGTGEDVDLAALSTIRLRAATGDVITDDLHTQGLGNVLVNAANDATLRLATADNGTIAVLAGRDVLANAATSNITASRDVLVQAGRDATLTTVVAGDDIDVLALAGNLSLTDGTANGVAGAGGTHATFGTAGAAGAVHVVAGGEPADLATTSTIRLRAQAGDVTSSNRLRTLGNGNILVNAARDASLVLATATNGSIGVLAGRDVIANAATPTASLLQASRDVTVSAGHDALIREIRAGDDIDVTAGNNLALLTGTALATAGSGNTGVTFGTAGAANAVTVGAGEDAQLVASTIRLRAANGSVAGAFTPALVGTTLTAANGEILVNAKLDTTILRAEATLGSIGVLAGNSIAATTLIAGRDIGFDAGVNAIVGSATAGDDIDGLARTGTLSLTSGLSLGSGAGGTSLTFGTPGAAGAVGIASSEDADLAASSTIRLRAAALDVTADSLHTQGLGNVLVNAARDASLRLVTATNGSIGVIAGHDVLATAATSQLTASRDVAVQAGNNATLNAVQAGDDIDLLALAGTLSLTTGLSQGTAGSGGSSVVFGTPGSAGAVAVASGEDADLAALSTIRLRAAAGDVITDDLHTQGLGNVLVNAARDASLRLVTADNGSIGVLAGRNVTATATTPAASLLTASRDVAIQAGNDATILKIVAGDDIDVAALAGDLVLTDATSTGAGAGGNGVTFSTSLAAGTLGAVRVNATEDAEFTGSSTIRLRAATGDVTSTGTLLAQGRGDVLVNAAQDAALNIATATNGSIGQLAGGFASANNLGASIDVFVQGGTGVNVGTAQAGDDIDVVALTNTLTLTTGLSLGTAGTGGSSLVFGAPGSLGAVTLTGAEPSDLAGKSTIRLRAAVGDIAADSLRTQGLGDVLVNASRDVTLRLATADNGSIGVLAGRDVLATAATSLLTASRDVTVSAGHDALIREAKAGDDIDMVAGNNLGLLKGSALATAGSGGTATTFGTAGAANAVTVGAESDTQLAASTIRLRAVAGSVSGDVASPATGTTLSTQAGDILANAKQDVTVLNANAKGGTVALLAGQNINATTLVASEDIAARAGVDATFGTMNAGDDIEITAGKLVTTTGAGSVDQAVTGADARHAVLDATQAGQAAGLAITSGDARGTASVSPTSDLAGQPNGRTITIEAADVEIGANLTATDGRIILRNNGTGGNRTTVGNPLAATTGFVVSETELNRLKGKTVAIDSGSNALELGGMTIADSTGSSDIRFLGTSSIDITGVVKVDGTAARTLQIGGKLGELSNDLLSANEPLATTIVARIDAPARPKILAGSSMVDLRGQKILFGTALMIDGNGTTIPGYLSLDDAAIAIEVSNPRSRLYSDATAQLVTDDFLVAKSVTVGYRNFALFQNIQVGNNKGVRINSESGVPTQTELALRLISTGDTTPNSFSMFGIVNGFLGTSAALLGNQAVQISNPAGDPNVARITRANSRLNGCLIGSPDKGCLATDVPQPNFDLYDERAAALFDVDDDSTIAVSPLIGRGNDGLIVNVADAPVGIDTIECRPEEPNCPAKEGE